MNHSSSVIVNISVEADCIEWLRNNLPRVFSCDPDWSVDRDSEVIVHTDAVESYLDSIEDLDDAPETGRVVFLEEVMALPEIGGATLRFYVKL